MAGVSCASPETARLNFSGPAAMAPLSAKPPAVSGVSMVRVPVAGSMEADEAAYETLDGDLFLIWITGWMPDFVPK